jgi:hypothetical protein
VLSWIARIWARLHAGAKEADPRDLIGRCLLAADPSDRAQNAEVDAPSGGRERFVARFIGGTRRYTLSRVRLSLLATVSCVVLALPARGRAQDEASLAVELRAPERLRAGDRAEILAEVRHAGPHPLLVTPRSEGTALEVARGRLLRADAVDASVDVLVFRIPVIAHEPGTAVVRVRVAGYACEARCRPIEVDAAVIVNIAPASGTLGVRTRLTAPATSAAHAKARGATSKSARAAMRAAPRHAACARPRRPRGSR